MHPTIESVVTITIFVITTTVKGYWGDWSDGDAIKFSSIKGSRSGPASTGEGRRSLICAAQALRAGNLDRGGSAADHIPVDLRDTPAALGACRVVTVIDFE